MAIGTQLNFPIAGESLSSYRTAIPLLADIAAKMNLSGKSAASYAQQLYKVIAMMEALSKKSGSYSKVFDRMNREMQSSIDRFASIASGTDMKIGMTPTEIKVAAQETDKYTAALVRTRNALFEAGKVDRDWIRTVNQAKVAEQERAGGLRATSKGYEILTAEGRKALRLQVNQAKALGDLYKVETNREKALRETNEAYKKNAQVLEFATGEVKKLGQATGWAGKQFDEGMKKIPDKVKDYEAAMKRATTATNVLNEGVGRLRERYPQAGAALDKFKAKTEAFIGTNNKSQEVIGKVREKLDLYGKDLHAKFGVQQERALLATRALDDGIGRLRERFPQAAAQIDKFKSSTEGFIGANQKSKEVVGQVKEQISAFGKTLEAQYTTPQNRALAATKILEEGVGRLRERFPQAAAQIDKFKSTTEAFIGANAKNAEVVGQVREQIAGFGKDLDAKFITPQERAAHAVRTLEDGVGRLREKFPQASNEIDKFKANTEGFIAANKNNGEVIGRVREQVAGFGKTLEEKFASPQERALAATRSMDEGLGRLSQRFPQAGAEIGSFKKQTEGFIAANKDSALMVGQVREQISAFGKELGDKYTAPQKQAEQATSLLGRSVGRLKERFPDAMTHIENFSNTQRKFIADNAGSDELLGRLSERIRLFGQALASGAQQGTLFSRAIEMFSNRFRILLTYFTAASVIRTIAGMFQAGAQNVIEYSQSLKDLQAITRATDEEIAVMGETIQHVAATTKFSIAEVAEGMRTLGQAGFSAGEALSAIQGVSDLATGTISSMALSVDIVTTALRVFQKDASQASHVADVFANAVNGSKLTIEKLRTAMNFVGPIAKQAGVSFEDLTASMMVLANQGIRASTIGTSLRQVFNKLSKPTKAFSDAVEAAGLSLEQLDPKFNKFEDVIGRLGVVTMDTRAAFEQFGIRGAAAISALVNAGRGGFLQMAERVNEAGTAAAMARKQMEGLQILLKNLRDRLGNLAVAFGKLGFQEILTDIVKALRLLVAGLTKLIDNDFVRAIAKIGVFIAKWGLLTFALVKIDAIILALGKTFTLLGTKIAGTNLAAFGAQLLGLRTAADFATASMGKLALSFAFNPYVLIAALTAGVAIFLTMRKSTEELVQETIKLGATYKDVVKNLDDYQEKLKDVDATEQDKASIYKNLRGYLISVAEGESELALFARRAAMSINGLTGELKDSGEALNKFNEEARKLQLSNLADKANLLAKNLRQVASDLDSIGFGDADYDAQAVELTFKQLLELEANLIDTNNELFSGLRKAVLGMKAVGEELLQQFMDIEGGLDLSLTNDQIVQMATQMGVLQHVTKDAVDSFLYAVEKQREALAGGSNILRKLYQRLGYENLSKDMKSRAQIIEQEWTETVEKLKYASDRFGEHWKEMWNINNGQFRKEMKSIMTDFNNNLKNIYEQSDITPTDKIVLMARLELDTLLHAYKTFYLKNVELFKQAYKEKQDLIKNSLEWEKQLIKAEDVASYDQKDFATTKSLEEKKRTLKIESLKEEEKATVEHHKSLYALAQQQVERIRKLYENDPPEMLTNNKEYKEALVEARDQGRALAQVQLDYRIQETESIRDELEKRVKDYEKYIKQLKTLEENNTKDIARYEKQKAVAVARFVKDAQKALDDYHKKLREINRAIRELKEAHTAELLLDEYDLERKIADVRREGMSDAELQTDYRRQSMLALTRAQNLFNAAQSKGDKAGIEAAENMLSLAESDISNIEDKVEKERLLRQSAEMLKRIKEETHRLELQELYQKQLDARREYTEEKKRREEQHRANMEAIAKERAEKQKIYLEEKARLEKLKAEEKSQIDEKKTKYAQLSQQIDSLKSSLTTFVDALTEETKIDINIVESFDEQLGLLKSRYKEFLVWFASNPLNPFGKNRGPEQLFIDFFKPVKEEVEKVKMEVETVGDTMTGSAEKIGDSVSKSLGSFVDSSLEAMRRFASNFKNIIKKINSDNEIEIPIKAKVNPTLPINDAIDYVLNKFTEMGKSLNTMGHEYVVGVNSDAINAATGGASSSGGSSQETVLRFDFGNGKRVGPVKATPSVRDALIVELNKAKRTFGS